MNPVKRINILNRNPTQNGFAASLGVLISNPKQQASLLKTVFSASRISEINGKRELEDFTIDKITPGHVFFLDEHAKSIKSSAGKLPQQFRIQYPELLDQIHDRAVAIITVDLARKLAVMSKKDYKKNMMVHDNVDFKNNEPLHGIIADGFAKAIDHPEFSSFGRELMTIHEKEYSPAAVYEHVLGLKDYAAKADTIHNDLLKNVKSEVYNNMNKYNETFRTYAESGTEVPINKVVDYYAETVGGALQNSWGEHATGFDWHKKGKCSVEKHALEIFHAPKVSLVTKSLPHNLTSHLGFEIKQQDSNPWEDAKALSADLTQFASAFEKRGSRDKVLVALFPHKKKVGENREPKYITLPREQFDAKAKAFHLWDDEDKHVYSFNDRKFELSVNGDKEVQDGHDWDHMQVASNIHLFHHAY